MTATTPARPARLSDRAVIPLRTLDPAGPQDDLGWLDQAIGGARVVAIGESAHYNRESFQLRHRVVRYLAERHGFTAYAMESGFVEGWLADSWARGAQIPTGRVMASGLTSLMGLWTQMRAQLQWMRQHNGSAARPVGFYGIDMPGSMVSLLPGLDAVITYLEQADPGFRAGPGPRETASAFAATSAFSAPAAVSGYGSLSPEGRDALTAGLADLRARMTARRLDYRQRTGPAAYERALRSLDVTVTLDAMARDLVRGDQHAMMLSREVTIADTVEWILGREDRIVLAAHNGHVQRWPVALPGPPPAATMGMHLADRLGQDYLVVGMTTGMGQTLNTAPDFYAGRLFTELEAPRPGSLDALMAASHDGPFAADLRRLAPGDAAAVRGVCEQRYGAVYSGLNPADAFDVVVHLPHVSPADPDPDTLACAPRDVQEAFGYKAAG